MAIPALKRALLADTEILRTAMDALLYAPAKDAIMLFQMAVAIAVAMLGNHGFIL